MKNFGISPVDFAREDKLFVKYADLLIRLLKILMVI